MKTATRNTSPVTGEEITITLRDGCKNTTRFIARFDDNDVFSTTEPSTELESHTQEAQIADLVINGDGWRHIESGGYLEDFIRGVLFGDDDTDEFFSNIAEALQATGDPGCLLYRGSLYTVDTKELIEFCKEINAYWHSREAVDWNQAEALVRHCRSHTSNHSETPLTLRQIIDYADAHDDWDSGIVCQWPDEIIAALSV